MSRYTPINLTSLPIPAAIKTPDYEAILRELKADVIAYLPELAPSLELESDPVTKILEVWAYFEMLRVARANDQIRAVHLATATGSDLEGLAALFGVMRLEVSPADPTSVPPKPAIMEGDEALRRRAQLALEGFSTAGPVGAYEYHARSADPRVRDVSVRSPSPGLVQLTLLSSEGDGTAGPDLIEAVSSAVNADEVRPLCDTVTVQSASFTDFTVSATLAIAADPGAEIVLAEARGALDSYLEAALRVGEVIRLSAIYAALHRPGVERVTLHSPQADIDPGIDGVARCTEQSLTHEVAS